MDTVTNAYLVCEQTIQGGSKTFYKAFSLLPKQDRMAVYAIYTFCRHLDDTVDESATPKESLAEFLEEFRLFRSGHSINKPLWIALADVFKRYEMDETPFLELAEGMRWDIEKNRYHSLEETEKYSYYVASTVGLMLLPILAPKQNDLRESAIQLGIAMQFTRHSSGCRRRCKAGTYLFTERLDGPVWCDNGIVVGGNSFRRLCRIVGSIGIKSRAFIRCSNAFV